MSRGYRLGREAHRNEACSDLLAGNDLLANNDLRKVVLVNAVPAVDKGDRETPLSSR